MLIRRKGDLGLWLGVALIAASGGASGQTLTTLHNFKGVPRDGALPVAGVVMDQNGNLFGTTYYGGKAYNCEGGTQGCGVVFKIEPDGHETLLTQFQYGREGSQPQGGLTVDASGDVYGTTAYGGKAGGGTVFEFAAGGGGETVLHDFGSKKKDGMTPLATPIRDQAGNLYGTTMQGGANVKGTVFKLAPDGHETILYSFCSLSGCTDGQWPYAGLVFDNAGNLYGTTVKGGNADCNCGTVFELSASGVETVLHAFVGGSDGATPFAGLMMDGSGNLFGTTLNGGGSTNCTSGCGTVFEIAEGGSESVIHAFSGTSDGAEPYAGLISDTNGNLYGTASAGGANNKGVIFKIAAGGTESVLYNFCNLSFCADGSTPYGTLIEDQNGNLFGTTTLGGVNIPGTVFELTN